MFAHFRSEKTPPKDEQRSSLMVLDTPTLNLCLRTPGSLEEIVPYGRLLLEGRGLLLCLNDLAAADKPRAQDYLAGVAYTIGATETEISPEVTMYLPGNVDTIHA